MAVVFIDRGGCTYLRSLGLMHQMLMSLPLEAGNSATSRLFGLGLRRGWLCTSCVVDALII